MTEFSDHSMTASPEPETHMDNLEMQTENEANVEFALFEVLKEMHTEYKGQRDVQTTLLKEIKELLETTVRLGSARVGKAKDTPVVEID